MAVDDEDRQRFPRQGIPDVSNRCTGSSRRSRASSGVRVAYVAGYRVVERPEVLEVVEKLFHIYSYSSAG